MKEAVMIHLDENGAARIYEGCHNRRYDEWQDLSWIYDNSNHASK